MRASKMSTPYSAVGMAPLAGARRDRSTLYCVAAYNIAFTSGRVAQNYAVLDASDDDP